MPPPKSKLYNKTGKHKTINTVYSNSNSGAGPPRISPSAAPSNATIASSTVSEMDTEAMRQLELELCWCVQTLEVSLQSGKLSEKQGMCVN